MNILELCMRISLLSNKPSLPYLSNNKHMQNGSSPRTVFVTTKRLKFLYISRIYDMIKSQPHNFLIQNAIPFEIEWEKIFTRFFVAMYRVP